MVEQAFVAEVHVVPVLTAVCRLHLMPTEWYQASDHNKCLSVRHAGCKGMADRPGDISMGNDRQFHAQQVSEAHSHLRHSGTLQAARIGLCHLSDHGLIFLACGRNDMHIKNKWNSRISRRVKNDEVWQPNPKDLQAEDAQDYAHIVNGLTEYLSKHEIHLVCWHLLARARQRQCALPLPVLAELLFAHVQGPTEPAGSIRVLVQKVAEVLRDNDSGQPRSRAHCSRKQMAHSSGSFSAASPALSTCTDRRGSPAIGGPGSCNALYNMHDGAAALGIPKYFGQHEVTLGGSESCQLSPGPFGIPALLEGPADLFLTHNIPHSLSSDILQIQSVLEVPQQASALQPRDSIGGYPPESSLPGHGGSHPHVDGYWSSCSMLQQFPATDLKPLQTHTANSLPAPWSEPGAHDDFRDFPAAKLRRSLCLMLDKHLKAASCIQVPLDKERVSRPAATQTSSSRLCLTVSRQHSEPKTIGRATALAEECWIVTGERALGN